MIKPNNGGPAFPTLHHDSGMTLRDYFAGQALAGFSVETHDEWRPMEIARDCYDQADAMLRARKE